MKNKFLLSFLYGLAHAWADLTAFAVDIRHLPRKLRRELSRIGATMPSLASEAGTALAVDLNVQHKGAAPDIRRYLVADNVKIYKGAIVVLDASGYARPARNTAGEFVIGVAIEQFDNTGTGHAAGATVAGKTGVRVMSSAHFLLLCSASAAQASVGLAFYALDDQTVRATATACPAGIVTEFVDATHVWVWIASPGEGLGAAGNVVLTGDSQIVAGNLRLGAISAFGTTEPTSAVVMKVGTNPVGAITTSGAIFVTTGGATISKIIADGTVSTIQT